MTYQVKFHGRRPPNYEKIFTGLKQDLDSLYNDLDRRPSKLIFHHYFPDGTDGPHISVWGDEDQPNVFQCEYVHKTTWVSIKNDKPIKLRTRRRRPLFGIKGAKVMVPAG